MVSSARYPRLMRLAQPTTTLRRMTHTESSSQPLPPRRKFMRHALALAGSAQAATLATPAYSAPIGSALPPHQRNPGGTDTPYGQPATAEAAVVRTESREAGFSVWRTPLQHQRGIITPGGLHFAVHHNGIPDIDPARHQLMLHGLVDRPLRLDWERLQRYPMVSKVHFLECAGNSAANALSPFAMDLPLGQLAGEVSCSEWTGIPLSLLMDEARPQPSAQWVIAEGADAGSHARSLPLQALRQHGMLALYQNGERLRPSQGYPMRLFVPGWEGNANVKWLHRLEFSDIPAHTKDESGLYTQVLSDGRIQRFALTMEVKSVITRPSGQQTLPSPRGHYEIEGLAWSGRGRIAQVEVSVDGGRSWTAAALHGPVLDRSFTRFTLPWQWQGQKAVLMSRATDEQGHTQPTRSTWKGRYAAHSFNHYNAIQAWAVDRDGRVENCYA